ncbi:iron chaperone [Paenarthrobacter sp. NPDC091711]|uniref:iron chaperone n=1 Tax=Paenarthrobacter sp. NPDC091711 TaxID=3364385 RepID=UPI003817BC11
MPETHPTVDAYISAQPEATQRILQEIRRTIHAAVPDAGEMISYGIPTITIDGHYVVYFAAWVHHISVYPVPRGDEGLTTELAPFLSGKGTLKFPLAKPIPYSLIAKVAAQLAAEKKMEH